VKISRQTPIRVNHPEGDFEQIVVDRPCPPQMSKNSHSL